MRSQLKERFQNDECLPADLEAPTVMVKMDVTDSQYLDGHFDVIFCNHVLEHPQNDELAMSELNRVLNRGGLGAILVVPIHAGKTFGLPTRVGPVERLNRYPYSGHVLAYGLDYNGRLLRAGFHVKRISAPDLLAEDDILRLRLAVSGDN